jgi:hypothetical protein
VNASSPFSFDLETILARPEFADKSKLIARLREVNEAHNAWHSKGSGAQNVAKLNSQFIRDCGHNYGLLMPFIFPKYPTERPLQFEKRPYMLAMSSMLTPMTLTLNAGRQVGKCVEGDTQLVVRRFGRESNVAIRELFESM